MTASGGCNTNAVHHHCVGRFITPRNGKFDMAQVAALLLPNIREIGAVPETQTALGGLHGGYPDRKAGCRDSMSEKWPRGGLGNH